MISSHSSVVPALDGIRRFLGLPLALVAVLCFWYGVCPTFDFPPATPFEGSKLFNPYASPAPRWLKTNLHAHSVAWGGLTNGHSSADDMTARYRAIGFDVAAVSNYQQISAKTGEIPVYEQGYSIKKAHFLVVGGRSVDWLDYPLLQGPNEKQDRIERLKRNGSVVIIAHPELRHGFTDSDLKQLAGYDAIEVASGVGNAEREWDVALSAGRLVWAVGNDDSHDSGNLRKIGRVWSMIAARSATPADLISAIRAGRTYAVVSKKGAGEADVHLGGVTVIGDTITVVTEGAVGRIDFIGQQGRLLASFPDTRVARFVMPVREPYARAVVQTAWTRLILNPIVRSSGARPPALTAAHTGRSTVSLTARSFLTVFTP